MCLHASRRACLSLCCRCAADQPVHASNSSSRGLVSVARWRRVVAGASRVSCGSWLFSPVYVSQLCFVRLTWSGVVCNMVARSELQLAPRTIPRKHSFVFQPLGRSPDQILVHLSRYTRVCTHTRTHTAKK